MKAQSRSTLFLNSPKTRSALAQRRRAGPNVRAAFDSLKLLQVKSCADLLRRFPSLSDEQQFVGLCIFCAWRYRAAVSSAFAATRSEDAFVRGRAFGALAALGGRRVAMRLVRTLQSAPKGDEARFGAVYALAHMRSAACVGTRVRALGAVLVGSDADDIRAAAAEGLMTATRKLRRSGRLYVAAARRLIESLEDESPAVRATAAFALGQLRERSSLEKLKAMARNDRAVSRGIGRVSDVARCAVRNMSRHTRERH